MEYSYQVIWGMAVTAWIAVVGVPYLLFTLGNMLGLVSADDPRITVMCGIWTPGFLITLLLWKLGFEPIAALIWATIYLPLAIVGWRWWRTKNIKTASSQRKQRERS